MRRQDIPLLAILCAVASVAIIAILPLGDFDRQEDTLIGDAGAQLQADSGTALLACNQGYQPYRYNAGGGAHQWTPSGAYTLKGESTLWTDGSIGKCCVSSSQCAFPNGCQNSGTLMGNYSFLCHTDQGMGTIFACDQTNPGWDPAVDGTKLFGDAQYCCSKFTQEVDLGPRRHAIPGKTGFAAADSEQKREIRRPGYDACVDGSDNDCDGWTDAADPDCGVPPAEIIRCPADGTVFAPSNPDFMSLVGNELQIALAYRADLDKIAALYETADVKNVRIVLNWREIERNRGVYLWESTDLRISTFADHGINTVGIIGSPPRWASSCADGDARCTPRDLNDLRRFARAAVKRFGPAGTDDVHDWEIRVEALPNGNRLTKEQYVAELNAAYGAIKQEDPSARIWGPEVAFLSNRTDVAGNANQYAWIDYTIAQGDFDVFSIHHLAATTPAAALAHTRRVRQRLDAAGMQDVPLAVTATALKNPAGTQAAQAKNLKDLYACISAGGADHAFWFAGTEWSQNISRIKDDVTYGLLDYKSTCDIGSADCDVYPKLAYYAYQDLSAQARS